MDSELSYACIYIDEHFYVHIMRRHYLLKHVIEGKKERQMVREDD